MKKALAAVALAAGLSACAGVPVVLQAAAGGAAIARSAYCIGITEGGKQAIRDWAAAGEQVIYCQAPEE